MLKKFKRIIIKIPSNVLIGILLIGTIIIIVDKTCWDFSFVNQFKSEIFEIIKSYASDFKLIYNKWIYVFYTIYILNILCLIFKFILKNESIKIMTINTFENTKVNFDTKYLYENTNFEKDLSKNIKLLENNVSNYTKIVEELDNYVKDFMAQKAEKYYAFAGILHTPFALRLGYKIGDETYFKLFHKKRKEDKFKLLSDKDEYLGNYTKMNVEKRLTESDTLVVSISTTFPITEEQLMQFNIENNNYLKFETIEKGFDVITSEKQINEYKDLIFKNIREITSSREIKVIHLCISSSVAFTFVLGQGFSRQYDSNVIIYNYDRQKYTWGLNLFETAENSIVHFEDNVMN